MFIDSLKAEISALTQERATLATERATLATERAALKAEAAAIDASTETRTAEQTTAANARVDEILARDAAIKERDAAIVAGRDAAIVADVAGKQARVDQLEALANERANAPVVPNFIKNDKPNIDDARTMSAAQMTDAITKGIEGRDLDPKHARSILKRHGSDRAWVQNLYARATDVYQSAWVKMMTGREFELTAEERTAMTVGSNTNGGFLVPTHLDPTIILTNDGATDVIRSISRVVTLTNGNVWNGVSSAGVTASWDPELTEVSDDTPTDYARVSVPIYKAMAFAQASFEAFEDIDALASDVLLMFADARERIEAAAHATGTGSGQPTGIFTALDANTNVEITSTTAATIGLVDLEAAKRAVGIRWRPRGSWVMNPVYGDAIKNLGTALSASYSTDLTQANTEQILGRPSYESDDAPSTQTTTVRDNEIVFGDFKSGYLIVDKPGSMSVEFVPNLFSTTTNLPDGRRGWLTHWRTGADSINDLAFSLLQDKTSA